MDIQEIDSGTEHERVVECIDNESSYHGIIAIHNTALGPAVGGTRVWPYATRDEALTDVLRLSRGMTYKAAVAGVPFGGGKAVIIADSAHLDRDRIFRLHGRFIEQLQGAFITGEDVGTTPEDMERVRLETAFVAGLPRRSGDPSPHTAHGVFRAMQAAAMHRWNSPELAGRSVAIQGCGHVGFHLARELRQAGARLAVTDIDDARIQEVVRATGAVPTHPNDIFKLHADLLAPCALGAVLNDRTIPQLQVQIVCGAANNQLAEDRHGSELDARGILYVPDYVANAGGIINGVRELRSTAENATAPGVDAIYETVLEILSLAQSRKISASKAADLVAERKFMRR